jgi:hypothetical protein
MSANEPPSHAARARGRISSCASGSSSAKTSQVIALAAKPNPAGRIGRKASTNRYAGAATNGCGRLVKTLQPAAAKTVMPRGTSTRLIASPSGMLWIAIARVMKMPSPAPPP